MEANRTVNGLLDTFSHSETIMNVQDNVGEDKVQEQRLRRMEIEFGRARLVARPWELFQQPVLIFPAGRDHEPCYGSCPSVFSDDNADSDWETARSGFSVTPSSDNADTDCEIERSQLSATPSFDNGGTNWETESSKLSVTPSTDNSNTDADWETGRSRLSATPSTDNADTDWETQRSGLKNTPPIEDAETDWETRRSRLKNTPPIEDTDTDWERQRSWLNDTPSIDDAEIDLETQRSWLYDTSFIDNGDTESETGKPQQSLVLFELVPAQCLSEEDLERNSSEWVPHRFDVITPPYDYILEDSCCLIENPNLSLTASSNSMPLSPIYEESGIYSEVSSPGGDVSSKYLIKCASERACTNSLTLNSLSYSGKNIFCPENDGLYLVLTMNPENNSESLRGIENLTRDTIESVSGAENLTRETSESVSGIENLIRETSESVSGIENLTRDTESVIGIGSLARDTSDSLSGIENLARDTSESLSGIENLARDTSDRKSMQMTGELSDNFWSVPGNGMTREITNKHMFLPYKTQRENKDPHLAHHYSMAKDFGFHGSLDLASDIKRKNSEAMGASDINRKSIVDFSTNMSGKNSLDVVSDINNKNNFDVLSLEQHSSHSLKTDTSDVNTLIKESCVFVTFPLESCTNTNNETKILKDKIEPFDSQHVRMSLSNLDKFTYCRDKDDRFVLAETKPIIVSSETEPMVESTEIEHAIVSLETESMVVPKEFIVVLPETEPMGVSVDTEPIVVPPEIEPMVVSVEIEPIVRSLEKEPIFISISTESVVSVDIEPIGGSVEAESIVESVDTEPLVVPADTDPVVRSAETELINMFPETELIHMFPEAEPIIPLKSAETKSSHFSEIEQTCLLVEHKPIEILTQLKPFIEFCLTDVSAETEPVITSSETGIVYTSEVIEPNVFISVETEALGVISETEPVNMIKSDLVEEPKTMLSEFEPINVLSELVVSAEDISIESEVSNVSSETKSPTELKDTEAKTKQLNVLAETKQVGVAEKESTALPVNSEVVLAEPEAEPHVFSETEPTANVECVLTECEPFSITPELIKTQFKARLEISQPSGVLAKSEAIDSYSLKESNNNKCSDGDQYNSDDTLIPQGQIVCKTLKLDSKLISHSEQISVSELISPNEQISVNELVSHSKQISVSELVSHNEQRNSEESELLSNCKIISVISDPVHMLSGTSPRVVFVNSDKRTDSTIARETGTMPVEESKDNVDSTKLLMNSRGHPGSVNDISVFDHCCEKNIDTEIRDNSSTGVRVSETVAKCPISDILHDGIQSQSNFSGSETKHSSLCAAEDPDSIASGDTTNNHGNITINPTCNSLHKSKRQVLSTTMTQHRKVNSISHLLDKWTNLDVPTTKPPILTPITKPSVPASLARSPIIMRHINLSGKQTLFSDNANKSSILSNPDSTINNSDNHLIEQVSDSKAKGFILGGTYNRSVVVNTHKMKSTGTDALKTANNKFIADESNDNAHSALHRKLNWHSDVPRTRIDNVHSFVPRTSIDNVHGDVPRTSIDNIHGDVPRTSIDNVHGDISRISNNTCINDTKLKIDFEEKPFDIKRIGNEVKIDRGSLARRQRVAKVDIVMGNEVKVDNSWSKSQREIVAKDDTATFQAVPMYTRPLPTLPSVQSLVSKFSHQVIDGKHQYPVSSTRHQSSKHVSTLHPNSLSSAHRHYSSLSKSLPLLTLRTDTSVASLNKLNPQSHSHCTPSTSCLPVFQQLLSPPPLAVIEQVTSQTSTNLSQSPPSPTIPTPPPTPIQPFPLPTYFSRSFPPQYINGLSMALLRLSRGEPVSDVVETMNEEELRQDGRTVFKSHEEKSFTEVHSDVKSPHIAAGSPGGDKYGASFGATTTGLHEHTDYVDQHVSETSTRNQFEYAPQQPVPAPRKAVDVRSEVSHSEAYTTQEEQEEGIYENQPEHRSDVVRESDRNIGAELPSIGMARNLRERFQTGQYEKAATPKKELTSPEVVDAGVYENQPQYNPDVVHSGQEIEDKIPEEGTARNLAAKFKQLEKQGSVPAPSASRREITPDRTGKVEYVSEPRGHVERYEGHAEAGIFESQPKERPDVVKSDELPEEILPERGFAKSVAQQFRQLASGSTPSPSRGKREITPDTSGRVEYVTEPRGHVETYEGHAESGVFESNPADRADVIKSDELVEEILPERGSAKNIAAKFKELESKVKSPPQSPSRHKEFTPPRENGHVRQSAVVENNPTVSPDVVHSGEQPQDVLPERGTAKNLVNRFRQLSTGSSPAGTSPKPKKEFTPPPGEAGVFENNPKQFIPDYNRPAESGILESTPNRRDDVIRAEDPPVYEQELPERGFAKNMVSAWRQRESENSKTSPTGSAKPKEFTPPREEPRVAVQRSAPRTPKSPLASSGAMDEGSIHPRDLPGQYQPQMEPSVFESEPHRLEGVVREVDTDWTEGMPKVDTTKKMLAKFRNLQEEAKKDSSKPVPSGRKDDEASNAKDSTQEQVGRSKSMRVAVQLEKCGACQRTVYAMEKIEIEKNAYHKACFRCSHCHAVLTPKTFAINNGTMFCTNHYKQLFATKGNYDEGFGRDQHKKRWKSEPNLVDGHESSPSP